MSTEEQGEKGNYNLSFVEHLFDDQKKITNFNDKHCIIVD